MKKLCKTTLMMWLVFAQLVLYLCGKLTHGYSTFLSWLHTFLDFSAPCSASNFYRNAPLTLWTFIFQKWPFSNYPNFWQWAQLHTMFLFDEFTFNTKIQLNHSGMCLIIYGLPNNCCVPLSLFCVKSCLWCGYRSILYI